MSTTEHILANVSYHAQLLASISELEYAPSAVSQQTIHLSDLKSQLSKTQANIVKLSEKTKKERKEHEALRDSTARRLAHKLTGRKDKFQAKTNKEEREYVEALEEEMRERDRQAVLEQLLAEANQVYSDLSEKATRYESLKAQLATLYSSVFDGPTPAFPAEDQLEDRLRGAQEAYDKVQAKLNSESQGVQILTNADNTMRLCLAKMQEALGYSTYDMWGGGSYSDMLERNALSGAQSLASQVQMLVQQAQHVSPSVQSIGPLRVAQGSIMSDVLFDNIFTDMAFHDKIKTSAAELAQAQTRLKEEVKAARRRAYAVGSELNEVAHTLAQSRSELDTLRREMFERIGSEQSSHPSDLPPGYDAPPAEIATPLAVPTGWGSRNPYAAMMANRAITPSADRSETPSTV